MNEIELYRTPATPPKKRKPRAVVRTGYVGGDLPLRTLAAEPMSAAQASPLPQHFDMLRRHWKMILGLLVSCTLAGFFYTYTQSPVYQARTTLEVQGLNDKLLDANKFDPMAGAEYTTEAYIQTQIKILKSDSLLERVANKLHYDTRPEFRNAVKPSWTAGPGASRMISPRDLILGSIRSRLKVEASGLTRILEVTFDSGDPQEAANFLNGLSSEYIEQSMDARGKGTEATSKWLQKQSEEARVKLERSDDALQAYARATGLIIAGEKDNLAEDKLKQLQTELSSVEAERMNKQAQYEKSKNAPAETLPEVLNDGSLRDYKQKLTELNRQLAEFSAALTPEHYKVKRVQAQIEELKNSLNEQRNNIVAKIKNEYESAQRREDLLKQRAGAQYSLLSDQAGKTTRYNILKREVEANRQMYDALLQQVRASAIATTSVRTSTVRVVDPAVAPSIPYKPSVLLNAGLGLFGGVLLSLAMLLFTERSNRTIQYPGDVTQSLNVRELGLIPSGRGRNLALATWEKKPSALAESFRSTVASMMYDKAVSKVVVFTSANRSEGKSTVISNVAIAWTETRQRVLLIDADMRRPALHKFFGASNTSGLTDLLMNNAPVDEAALSGVVQATVVPNLWLLPSGPGTPDILNLEYSTRLQELLAICRQSYDVVLIDTPPALQMPDARILARLADHVVLVIRSGRTARGAAILAAQRFAEDGTPILGSILNSLDFDGTRDIYRAYGNR